jgi:uncharacterized membrane protein YdfJ with MMPL/SSD domain
MSDLLLMDFVCIPLGLLVLIVVLKSVRVVNLTIVCTATSILTSFLIAYPIAPFGVNVATFAPSVMMSVCLALSVDYSLFLLSRFRQDLIKGLTPIRSARLMVQYAGRIIMLSGTILSVCLVGNLFLPVQMIRSLGFCSAIATFDNVMVNITLIPALVVFFPSFFSSFSFWGTGECWKKVPCCWLGIWNYFGI